MILSMAVLLTPDSVSLSHSQGASALTACARFEVTVYLFGITVLNLLGSDSPRLLLFLPNIIKPSPNLHG